jgi:hypothetical protein
MPGTGSTTTATTTSEKVADTWKDGEDMIGETVAKFKEEFGRIFLEEVVLDRASVEFARRAYLDVQSRAKDAGIPGGCLRYVESIDINSEDSKEILKSNMSTRKEVPRCLVLPRGDIVKWELYPPNRRVEHWANNIDSAAPFLEDELDPDSSTIPSITWKSFVAEVRPRKRHGARSDTWYAPSSITDARTSEVDAIAAKNSPCHDPEQRLATRADTSQNADQQSSVASGIVESTKNGLRLSQPAPMPSSRLSAFSNCHNSTREKLNTPLQGPFLESMRVPSANCPSRPLKDPL